MFFELEIGTIMAKMKMRPLPMDIQFFLKRLNPGDKKEREEMKDNDIDFGKNRSNEFVIYDDRVADVHGALWYAKFNGVEGWYLQNYDKKFGTFYDGVNVGDKYVLVHPGVPIRLTEDASSSFCLEIDTSKKRECKPSSSSSVWSTYEHIAEDEDVFKESDAFVVKDGASSDSGVNSVVMNSDDALVEENPIFLGGTTTASRKRKSDVEANYITPKRKPGKTVLKKKIGENEHESYGCKVVLDKKLLPLKPYLDEFEASGELIKSLNGKKSAIALNFMETIMKSFGDRVSCIGDDCKSLSDGTKMIKRQITNQLIRARKIKELGGGKTDSKIQIVDSCLMRENCVNIFHREFEGSYEVTQVKLGKYVFGRKKTDDSSWLCLGCKSYQSACRERGKEYDLFGYLQYNRQTGNLEDKLRVPRTNVDPELPGGKPHICNKKAANDDEIKIEKSVSAMKKKQSGTRLRIEKFEMEIDAFVKKADETSFSNRLKKLLERLRGSFGFDSNHRRYFVYFITFSGEKNILYYGITYDPNHRLYHHKTNVFSGVVKTGRVLQMHLIPLGTINSKFAGELETAFIRLSKDKRLKEGNGKNSNESNGEYSKRDLLKPVIEARHPGSYNELIESLNELIQVTYAQGNSLLSSDVVADTTVYDMKRRLSDIARIVKIPKRLTVSTSSTKMPLNFDNIPSELQEFLDKLKMTFKFSEGDTKYFIYFFAYENEPGVLWYGITTDPVGRWNHHRCDSIRPMFKFFNSDKKLRMHIIPLGDIDCMFAAELETILIRLSKGGYLDDGNVAVNISNGNYQSIYSFNEELLLSDDEAFDVLVMNMNSLIAATIGSNKYISE